MPRRGPSKETFAAVVQLWVQRIHTVRTERPYEIMQAARACLAKLGEQNACKLGPVFGLILSRQLRIADWTELVRQRGCNREKQ